MAAEISSIKKKKPPGFMTLLSSAACEWFLMFLLFLDAGFAYLLTRFASYCDLETPCLLCSRLDLVFGKKKPECYWSVLCAHHREEISSLASCSTHGKVAEVHGMCEECLMPIAKQNKANPECYRLLVGKLWVDVERSVLQHLLLNKYVQLGFSGRRTCSCCNKTWRAKSNADRLLEFTQVGYGASKANVKPPLPRVPGRSRFSRRDSLKRIRDKFTGPVPVNSAVSDSSDSLSYVGYSKLKISSDSESEITISEDDDDGNASTRGKSYATSEDDVQFSRSGVTKKLADNVVSGKLTNQSFQGKSVILDQLNLLDLSEHKNVNYLSSDILTVHGLRELEWAESFHTPRPSFTDELITLDDGYHTPDAGGDSVGAGMLNSGVSPPHMPALSVLSEILSLYNGPSSSSSMVIPEKTSNSEETSGKGNIMVIKEIKVASSDKASSSDTINTNLTVQSSESRELLGVHVVKPIMTRDSAKTEEQLKSLPQGSTSEVRLSLKDDGFRAHVKHGESRTDEDYSSQVLSISASVVKDYSRKDEDSIIQALPVSASPMKDSYRKDEEFSSQASPVSVSLVNHELAKDKDSGSHALGVSSSSVKDEASIPLALSVSAALVKDSSRKDEDSSSQALPILAPLVKNDSNKDKDSISQALQVSGSMVKLDSGKSEDSSSQALSTSASLVSSKDVDLNSQVLSVSASVVKNDSKKDKDSSSLEIPVSASMVKYDSGKDEDSTNQVLPISASDEKNVSNTDKDSSSQVLPVSAALVDTNARKDEDSSSQVQPVSISLENNDSRKDESSVSQVLPVTASLVNDSSRKDENSSAQALPVSASLVKDSTRKDEDSTSEALKIELRKDEDSTSQALPIPSSQVQNETRKDEDSNAPVLPISASTVKNDSRKDEASSSQARSVVINESNYESLVGITVSYIEGETVVDLLKRQVDHDRNLVNSLYKELEEVRNASSIAANEAMAMISRFQEEKAASLLKDSTRKDGDSSSEALKTEVRKDGDSSSEALKTELRKDEVSSSEALKTELRKDVDSSSEALNSEFRKDEGSTSQALQRPTSHVQNETRKDEDSNSPVLPISASMVQADSKKDEYSSSQMLPISTSHVKNDSKKDEDSSSQAPPLVMNESNYESLDGITVSYIEGETVVDLLKRQVDHDRELMNSLYKELEEERNASSIAANEAMAMITRLQEEKAALHMEALQYLRMMEEQAEYDMEALERANVLLAEKEKELQDLEYELEFYRMNILDESGEQDIPKETSVEKNQVVVHVENRPAASILTKSTEILKVNGDHKRTNSSVTNFEDEKLYITQCLKKLEEKLHQAYGGEKLDSVPNGLSSENTKAVGNDFKDLPPNSRIMINKEDSSLVQKDGIPAEVTTSNGAMYDKENDNKSASRGEIVSDTQKEIAELHDRLEALEADREFLRHASDFLHNGKDGSQFIQDIAHQLQELRKLEFRKR